ncbi:MAG: tetratricopeptide repeat protein [Marinosulfonomonas sp.]|nr:tetratricopeptide repeat protein [Marinosulfonomonas sp.]
MPDISIKLFGALSVSDANGVPIAISGNKQQALLAYLAMNIDSPPSRDRVMAMLWGDRFTDQARQSLRQGLSKLRQAIDPEKKGVIRADQDRLGLNGELVDVDLSEFQKLAQKNTPQADALAIGLFQSNLLDGLYVREATFEDWFRTERSRISQTAFPVFERLAAHYLKTSEQAKSQAIALQLIEIETLRESSHRLLMRILAQSGQRAAAIKQYNTCAEILKRELNVDPDPETQQLLENIKSPTPLPIKDADSSPPLKPDAIPAVAANGAVSSKVTITVLPFSIVGADPDLEPFAEGLTEDTTAALTKFRWFDVIVRLPVETGPVTTPILRQLATDHHVRYSVEGSVRLLGKKLRITTQLVDLESGKYISVNRLDGDATEIFQLLDELSETMAASVESELVAYEGDKARSLNSDAMGAWDVYHLGLAAQYEFSAQGNARAQSLFRRAIALDPMFAAAYARLSYALVLSAIYFEADQNSGLLEDAQELARKATRLDDQDAVARFAYGRVYLAKGEYQRSITEMEHAILLNPSLAQAHCGLGDSLAYLGRATEAIPSFEEATRLSPHDPHRWAFSMYAAIANIFNGDYDRAENWARSSVSVPNSHFWANAALVSALGHLGRKDEAISASKDLFALKPEFSRAYARDRLFYLRDKAQVDRYIEGLEKAGVA